MAGTIIYFVVMIKASTGRATESTAILDRAEPDRTGANHSMDDTELQRLDPRKDSMQYAGDEAPAS